MLAGIHNLPSGRCRSIHWTQCLRALAPDDEETVKHTTAKKTDGPFGESPETAAGVTSPVVADSKGPTITHSVGPRSYPLEAMDQPAAQRPPNSQVLLGGAVAVLMLGALASSLKLTFGSSHQGAQPLLPTSQNSTSNGTLSDPGSALWRPKAGHAEQWWNADTVFLVTEAADPQDPASASPVLIRTTHGEILAVFETEAAAAQLAERLVSWGQLVTGAAQGSVSPISQFRVAALQPQALNIQNVPPTVLIGENQMTCSSLGSPEAWQEVVTEAAPEQLRAWQEHVVECQAPVVPADATDVVAPATNEHPQTQVEPDLLEGHSKQESTPAHETAHPVPDSGRDTTAGTDQDSSWRQLSPNTGDREPSDTTESAATAGTVRAQTLRKQSESTQATHSSSGVHNGPKSSPQKSANAAVPEEDIQLEDMEPAVYASVEEMEDAERRSRGSDYVEEEPLRLLSEAETDASLVHRNYTALPVVFVPMLFRAAGDNGSSQGGDGDNTERMLFTVDTTIDEGDPDIVALVFEDPVDASALLSMLAHVRGFRDPDAVTRRVVPMPAQTAQDIANGQGASVLCMAKGFQKKAEVRAGREIDGLLSKIAGARWASLVDAQMVS